MNIHWDVHINPETGDAVAALRRPPLSSEPKKDPLLQILSPLPTETESHLGTLSKIPSIA